MSVLLATLMSCEKEELTPEFNSPIDELQDAINVPPPLALTAPSDGGFTLENPCTDEDLLRIEQERLIEEESVIQVKALPNGPHSFTYDVTLSKSLSGTTLYSNTYAKGEITAGGITYKPRFYWSADVSGGVLQNTQAYIKNTVTFDPTFKITISKSVTGAYHKNLIDDSKTIFSIVGGFLPTWVTLRGKLDASVYMSANASCWMKQKIKIVSSTKIGSKWVKDKGWSNISENPSPTYTSYSPSYSWKGNFTIQPALKAEVSANLYTLLGPRLTITPYYKFYLNASSRYIDRTAYLKGDVYFSLRGFDNDTDFYSRNVYNKSHSFSRINF